MQLIFFTKKYSNQGKLYYIKEFPVVLRTTNELSGFISYLDLLRFFTKDVNFLNKTYIRDVAYIKDTKILALKLEDTLSKAAMIIYSNGIGSLPVIENEKKS